jgi:hypothetical protein
MQRLQTSNWAWTTIRIAGRWRASGTALLLVMSVQLRSSAATWYVAATNSSDSYAGTSTNQPFATPQKAISVCATQPDTNA